MATRGLKLKLYTSSVWLQSGTVQLLSGSLINKRMLDEITGELMKIFYRISVGYEDRIYL